MTDSYSRRELLAGASVAAAGSLISCRPAGTPAASAMTELSATAAVAAMQVGDITAEAYASALLERAERLQSLNAFRTLAAEDVMAAARAADQLRVSGARMGPLHGLPIPVKDSVNTAAYATSNGTAILEDFRPAADAGVLTPLLEAGAIVMGKTNLHELSLGWTSDNPAFGAVHNPYDPARVPGGSSGGSAVAVAARMAPLAIAEDTLGSIRIPATMCGICGLRPTFGRYPGDGIMPLTRNQFDQVGPLARTVEDLALFDSVVAGERSPLPAVNLSGVRIGVADYFLGDLDSEVARISEEAIGRLRDSGATVVRADIPEVVKSALAVVLTIIRADVRSAFSAFLAEQDTGVSFEQLVAQTGPDIQALMSVAPPCDDVHEQMLAARGQVIAGIVDYFSQHEISALAFPPALIPAHPIGEDGSVMRRGELQPNTTTIGRNVALSSCASLASLVLPAGMTADGLPVGLEFDSLPGTDRDLLGLGVSLQAALGAVPPPAL